MNTFAPSIELQALEKLREEELEEARALQSVMLPRESLCSRGVTISHQFQPVSVVGGDFLDYFELTDGSIGLYLGDVSGKGLPAAFFGALAVGTLRGVHKTGISSDQVLATMNRRLMIRGLPARHAALQYAVFNPSTREIQISTLECRGHCISPARVANCSSCPAFLPDSGHARVTKPQCCALSRATPFCSAPTV
jgi:serine phosphatase RsbU (regulator of sigma subunit)